MHQAQFREAVPHPARRPGESLQVGGGTIDALSRIERDRERAQHRHRRRRCKCLSGGGEVISHRNRSNLARASGSPFRALYDDKIEVIFVDEHDPDVTPLGVEGVGEIGIVGTAAAVVNAIFHATGKRVRSLPVTIDKLLGC